MGAIDVQKEGGRCDHIRTARQPQPSHPPDKFVLKRLRLGTLGRNCHRDSHLRGAARFDRRLQGNLEHGFEPGLENFWIADDFFTDERCRIRGL